MTLSKPLLFLLFFLLSFLTSFSQSIKDFNDVLDKQIVGKVIIKKIGGDISQRTYLGIIKDKSGKTKYHVVKEFLRIKAAIVYHGHSRILFFNPQNKLVLESILSLPSELPFKLHKNSLYFKYKEGKLTKVFIQPVSPLLKMICVEPKSCYEVSEP